MLLLLIHSCFCVLLSGREGETRAPVCSLCVTPSEPVHPDNRYIAQASTREKALYRLFVNCCCLLLSVVLGTSTTVFCTAALLQLVVLYYLFGQEGRRYSCFWLLAVRHAERAGARRQTIDCTNDAAQGRKSTSTCKTLFIPAVCCCTGLHCCCCTRSVLL